MKEGDKVKWTDGAGFEHIGIVKADDPFMIPVRTKDGRIIRIRYADLNLCEEAKDGITKK